VTWGCALDLFTQRFVAPGFPVLAVDLLGGAIAADNFEKLVDHARLRVEQHRVDRLQLGGRDGQKFTRRGHSLSSSSS